MQSKNMKRFTVLLASVATAALMLGGCSDGKDGAAGAPGADGQGVATKAVESCSVCHGDGKAASVDAAHGLANFGDLVVTVKTAPAVVGADLVMTFNVKRNGANVTNYTNFYKRNATSSPFAYRLAKDDMKRHPIAATGTDNDGTTPVLDTTGAASGDYKVTITGGAAKAAIDSRYMFRLSDLPISGTNGAMLLVDYPNAPVTDLFGASSKSCEDCHGTLGNGFHYGSPAYGGKTCVVCHDAVNTTYPRLPALIHGIHQSGNMPTGKFTAMSNAATPAAVAEYAIKFPSYMDNCSICHKSGAPLTTVNTQAITYDFCMTCHQNWDGFTGTKVGGAVAFHRNYTSTVGTCATCHDGATAPATMGAMHNAAGLYTERSGLVYNGEDISVTEGAKVVQKITGVTRTGKTLAIKWTAEYPAGTAVNPCNATATTTAPAFAYAAVTASGAQPAVSAQNFSILKAFFQGDDLVNANNGATSPGQPLNTALTFTGATPNTVCSSNVATTTITLTDKEAALTGNARVGLQGKPMLVYAPANNRKILVRAKSPIYDFKLADGAAIPARRPVADTDKCLKCHVGSLYQHGGNRVDSVELCVMCHNEASSEQNNRVAYGVTAANSYDGKVGQTYGFKSMLHAVHASGTPGFSKPIAFYRSNGIYTFALTEAALFGNWPGAGAVTKTYGTNPANTDRTHNFASAHYPRALQDCLACHASNFSRIPDPTKAVATTLDAGAAPWDNQLDDTLQGATAAACTSCHSNSATAAHAAQFGFTPAVLEKGRQTVFDTANQ
ncbi:multiheme c-type cytochrome [Pelotalea chapellei]|uniref:Cytochrome c domain-containing protein n=1 Tax=Pelotalea chapellei TaxID=44671 RepID=A0ABS5U986_9BACT|nr:hypothetical protein [Pelotalea chapellei]MBT1072232.1 hypothetical protein [Pelotalea chapellei]